MYRPSHIDYSTSMMVYDSATEFHLNKAIDSIKHAQQVHKRDLEKKEEVISALQKRVHVLQCEGIDFKEFKSITEKENRELIASNHSLERELTIERRENKMLTENVDRLRQDLRVMEEKITHLESEHEKANHIIKNLLKKLHNKPI